MSKLSVMVEGYSFEIELSVPPQQSSEFEVLVDGQPVKVVVPNHVAAGQDADWFIVDGRPCEVLIDPDLHWIRSHLGIFSLEVQDLEVSFTRPSTGDGRVKAPIPGQISEVLVVAGQDVQTGQALVVLEAMKMENEIRAPISGLVKAVHILPGQRVALHELLVEID
ncbi:MAG: biotin/lipoyl-containing protein [Chloroflexota bacterium]